MYGIKGEVESMKSKRDGSCRHFYLIIYACAIAETYLLFTCAYLDFATVHDFFAGLVMVVLSVH